MKLLNFTAIIPICFSLAPYLLGAVSYGQDSSPGVLTPGTVPPAIDATSPAVPPPSDSTSEPSSGDEPQPTILDEAVAPPPGDAAMQELPSPPSDAPAAEDIPLESELPTIENALEKPAMDALESRPAGSALDQPVNIDGQASPSSTPPIMGEKKRFQFSADFRALYDDNINYSNTNPLSDFVLVASPRFAMNFGDFVAKDESYAMLSYNPEAIYFTEGTAETALDQNLKTQLQYAIGKVAVNLDGGYQRLSGATPDLGERAERDLVSLKTAILYGFGARLEAETSFLYSTADYDLAQFADYSEYVNELLFRYQLTARTKVAVGAGIGRLEIDTFGSQDFQRALVEALYEASDRLSVKFKGGLEVRHLEVENITTPILAISGEYKFTDQTSVGLNLYRDVLASGGSPGQIYTRTGISASLRHRFGEKWIGEFAVGYENAEYKTSRRSAAAAGQATGSRSDNSFYIRPSLTYQMREDRRLQVYYMHRTNESGQEGFDFEGNQIGVSAGIDF